jgi:hypothetical protein
MNLVPMLLQTLATSKLLHTGDINTVNRGTIISQQGGQRAADNLRPVHNTDSVAKQTISGGQDSVVDIEVLEDLDDGQRGAGQDALLALGLRVQEADVLVHVEDVAVAETLDIFGDVDDLLQVLVLAVVEDRVVDDDAVDVVVGVGGQDGSFDVIAGDFAEGIRETTREENVRLVGFGSSWRCMLFRSDDIDEG